MELKENVSNLVFFIGTVCYVVSGLLFYRVLCCLIVRKKGWLYTALLYVSCVTLCGMVIYPNDFYNVTLDFVWMLVLVLVCFRGKPAQKLAAAAVLYPIVIALNFLLMDLVIMIFVQSGSLWWVESVLELLQSASGVLFWYAIYRAFAERLRLACKLFDGRTWGLLASVCMASMVSITTCVYFAPRESWKIWPCALACIATNIGSLYLTGYFVKSIHAAMEQKNQRLQQAYYEELENNQQQIRKVRHDMNNHLGVIRRLVETGSREEASAYFREVESQIRVTNRVFCKNSIINAVLNAKYNMAMELGIDCFFHIELDNILGIDPVSLCSVFSNTLDNAIEASQKIPDPAGRKLSVKARCTENGYFSYEIWNKKNNEVVKQKERFLSEKEGGGTAHGLGLMNVREIVDKYEGTMDVSYTSDTFTVTVLIGNAV